MPYHSYSPSKTLKRWKLIKIVLTFTYTQNTKKCNTGIASIPTMNNARLLFFALSALERLFPPLARLRHPVDNILSELFILLYQSSNPKDSLHLFQFGCTFSL